MFKRLLVVTTCLLLVVIGVAVVYSTTAQEVELGETQGKIDTIMNWARENLGLASYMEGDLQKFIENTIIFSKALELDFEISAMKNYFERLFNEYPGDPHNFLYEQNEIFSAQSLDTRVVDFLENRGYDYKFHIFTPNLGEYTYGFDAVSDRGLFVDDAPFITFFITPEGNKICIYDEVLPREWVAYLEWQQSMNQLQSASRGHGNGQGLRVCFCK